MPIQRHDSPMQQGDAILGRNINCIITVYQTFVEFSHFCFKEKTIEKAPGFDQLQRYFHRCEKTGNRPNVDSSLNQLIHWCITAKNFRLKSCDKDKVGHLLITNRLHVPHQYSSVG